MLPRSFRLLALAAVLASAGTGGTAFAQCCVWNPCCCCPPPIRVTACYQTVPVTEYREVRQTVQRPVVETTYVDQPVTEYRQVVENKTAEVPTVAFQNVTEMRTFQRDCGHWETQYHQRPTLHPCQYDNRPDIFGFLNRTGYSIRMAFTPQVWAERIYVPNVVAEQVPVTRQVAVRGSQTINYQVCRMVPVTTTRKVAVNTVKMVAEEIVTQRPVTVFKTVPLGSSLALGVPATAPTPRTALQPPAQGERTAIMPRDTRKAAAPERPAARHDSLNDDEDAFNRDPKSGELRKDRSSLQPTSGGDDVVPASAASDEEIAAKSDRPIGRWVARKKSKGVSGPSFPEVAQIGELSRKR